MTFYPTVKRVICNCLAGVGGGIGVGSLGMSPQNPGSGRFRATTECVLVRHLGEYFSACLEKEGLSAHYRDTEMPSAISLCRMELNGFGLYLYINIRFFVSI